MVQYMNDSEYIEKLQIELEATRERAANAEQRVMELMMELQKVTSALAMQKGASSPSNGSAGDPSV